MLLRWVGHVPFHSVRRFFYSLAGIKMGGSSAIHMWANFFQPKNISIGEDTIVGDHAFLDGRATLTIGNHVDIASSVMIYNSEHDLESEDFGAREEVVEIGDYVFVGPRAIILPGVKSARERLSRPGQLFQKMLTTSLLLVAFLPRSLVSEKTKTPSMF